jgi:hypothetical protein
MIYNSALQNLQKWKRLQQKQLNQQFLTEIIQGLSCSPFEAKAILNAVYQVYQPYFDVSPTLKPGQILFHVLSIETGPSTPLAESQQVTVTLTLDAGEEDLTIRAQHGIATLRRHRMQRVCHEAFQQGGVLTREDLAIRLFNCGERTISRDLQHLKAQDIILPLRSTIKDMGRAICHRSLIVQRWLAGKEYSEISQSTHHSIPSVKNYIGKFKRVVALAQDGHEASTIAFLVKLSPSLVEEYYRLYTTSGIVPHRHEELAGLAQKNFGLSRTVNNFNSTSGGDDNASNSA